MKFEYTGCFYVKSKDLTKMFLLCRDKSYTPREAFNEVSETWDNEDFYTIGLVEDQILAEIEKMIKGVDK